jgi:tRNA nucleotidyltransferase (CCA-adding enzyme)
VRGFSGYLCELLIQEYGSFKQLTKKASNWKEKEIIDPGNHYNDELPEKLKNKFSNDSLIVIDPVDPERNVASVLDSENYSEFIHRCWRFQKNPGLNFFEQEEIELDKFALEQEVERRSDFLVLEFDSINEPDDIVYPQMRKAMRRLNSELEKNQFRIYEKGFHVGKKIRVFFELDSQLPEVEYQKGPKVYHGAQHLEEFTSKYGNTFVKGERLVAKVDREFKDAKSLIKKFLSEDVKGLKQKGIPGNVAEKMVDFKMSEPVVDDNQWLKFLAQKLKLVQ